MFPRVYDIHMYVENMNKNIDIAKKMPKWKKDRANTEKVFLSYEFIHIRIKVKCKLCATTDYECRITDGFPND